MFGSREKCWILWEIGWCPVALILTRKYFEFRTERRRRSAGKCEKFFIFISLNVARGRSPESTQNEKCLSVVVQEPKSRDFPIVFISVSAER